ncbi:MAG: hypothetical protein ABIX12_09010, partial [Rubrivivax sp.]
LRSSYAANLAGAPATSAAGTPHAPGGLERGSKRAFSANQTITTLVPGRLHRVGCVVRAERLSWLPSDLDGYEPLNAYVVTDEQNCVFVEPGMPILLPALKAAIETLVGERKVWVNFTRNEADCIGNMGYVFGTCPQPTLLFGGAGGILEWINDPAVSILEVRDFLGRIPIVEAKNGTTRDIGALRFGWLEAAYRQMLITQWAYEASTGCLFTSDAMGYRHLSSVDAPPVIDSPRNLPAVETVTAEIARRMNWLRESDYPEVLERFEAVFRERDVQIVAPIHGCVIKGREAVAAHVKLVSKALRAARNVVDAERARYV